MNDITPIRPAGIAFRDVSIVFEDGTRALRELSLDIREGELVVLVGPSGCGKSTALRALAGLEEVSSGQITIGARDVTDLDPQDRDIAMVFQNYALYPHKTIYENLAYPLRVRRVDRTELDRRVRQTAELLALTPFLHRKPRALSGGQRQRVAMGRALVREPVAFLMDEPLSNLDAALRVEMRTEILALHRKLGVTTVYVTHDQVEAMTMGDRVAVMRGGVLQQFDTPQALYDHPRNLFVGSFVGSPATNLAMGRVAADGGSVEIAGQTVKLPPGGRLSGPLAGRAAGSAIVVGIRPEAFEHVPDGEHDASFVVTPSLVEFLGSELFVHFKLGQAATAIVEDGSALPRVDGVAVGKPFVARMGPRSGLAAGQPTTLWFRNRDILLFDAEDGNRVD